MLTDVIAKNDCVHLITLGATMSFYSIDSELICDLWVQTLDQTQSLCQGIFFLRGG